MESSSVSRYHFHWFQKTNKYRIRIFWMELIVICFIKESDKSQNSGLLEFALGLANTV